MRARPMSISSRISMSPVSVTAAVEGRVDEAVARRLLSLSGASLAQVYGRRGKTWLDMKIGGLCAAGDHQPWLVLRDADRDGCPVDIRKRLLPKSAKLLCFRIAVRSVEAWLMADREGIGAALRVPVSRVPASPEEEEYPKRCLIDLARRSRSLQLRRMLVPRDQSGAQVGPEFESWAANFASRDWDVERARPNSPSLERAVVRIQELVAAAPR